MSQKRGCINAAVVLLCERMDIAQFLQAYCRYLSGRGIALPSVQIINIRNFERLEAVLEQLGKQQDAGCLRRLYVFADGSDCVRNRNLMLYRIGLREFVKRLDDYAYYLFPGRGKGSGWRRGYLEDMLLDALQEATAESEHFMCLRNVAEDFLLCANTCRQRDQHLRIYSRHLLYAYFAATERFVGLRLGEAARIGAFDLEHPRFRNLKRFLLKHLL